MIEVILKEEEKTVEKIKFPVLMRSCQRKQIVLFTSEHSGTCLEGGSENLSIGCHADRWVSCFDLNYWEKYEGEITLKNK